MKKKRQTVPLAMISLNTGQLAWLPKNPRQWTATDIERTASSITEDPDFLEDRPLLVTPLPAGGFVAFAGNLRHEGAVKAGLEEVPCVVYRPENGQDYETIKRRAMKDNGSFGSWDYDTLANEWDDLPLTDWGVPAWDTADTPSAASSAPQTRSVKGFRRNHVLISYDINSHEEVMEAMSAVRSLKGVIIEMAAN